STTAWPWLAVLIRSCARSRSSMTSSATTCCAPSTALAIWRRSWSRSPSNYSARRSSRPLRRPGLVINGVSLLKTELSNGQPHHVLVINFQSPQSQEIECRHGPCEAGTEVRPHPMAHFLAMEDRGEHRQHGFHQHARVPGAPRTDFHIGRVPGLRMEPRIGQDDHLAIKPGNEGLKMRIVDVGG